MLEKMIMDVSQVYHEALNLFPYWDDFLLKKWRVEYLEVIRKLDTNTTLDDSYHYLMTFVATLNDGHSLIYLPESIKKTALFAPVKLAIIDNELVICETLPEYKDYLYLPIKQINEYTSEEFINTICSYYWKSNPSVSLIYYQSEPFFVLSINKYLIRFKNGKSKEVLFLKQPLAWDSHLKSCLLEEAQTIIKEDSIEIHVLSKKAIIKIKHFMSPDIVENFYNSIDIIKETDEIIFDLRGNMGGNSGLANEIAQAFFKGEFSTERTYYQVINGEKYASATQILFNENNENKEWQKYLNHQQLKEEEDVAFFEERKGLLLNKTVKIIIDDQTYSSAENFVMIFDNYQRATIFGETSAGSTGQPALIKLETGGTFMVTAKKVEYPNGKRHHNIGIVPQVVLKRSLQYKQVDSVLDEVIQFGL